MELYKHTFKAMGSPCAVHFYAPKTQAQQIANGLMQEVYRLEHKYSRYREDSVAAQINRAAMVGDTIELDAETSALMDYAEVAWQQSNGMFDITSGVLRKAWDFKSSSLPTQDQITPLLERIGWQHLVWKNPQLNFLIKGMEVDFGGYVKEYAADCVAALALKMGVQQGLVELGGDIRVIGPHPDGRPWSVGVRHPRKAGAVLATLELQAGAVASSGDYERCIVHNGKRYGHVLNPQTGWPVEGLLCATVVAEHCLLAGTTSTLSLLQGRQGLEWLNEQGVQWLAMDENGQVHGTILQQ